MRSDEIRSTLRARYDELNAEYEDALAQNHSCASSRSATPPATTRPTAARRWPSGTPRAR